MSIFEKLKLIVWLNSLWNKLIKGGNKMSGLMQKLDNYKSVAGLLIVLAYFMLPLYTGIRVPDFIYKFGLGLASVGLAHKLEKGTGLLSAALDGLKAALGAITAKEEGK